MVKKLKIKLEIFKLKIFLTNLILVIFVLMCVNFVLISLKNLIQIQTLYLFHFTNSKSLFFTF